MVKDPGPGTWVPYYKNGVLQGTDYAGKPLDVYEVPGYGSLALLDDQRGTTAPSAFIDPATKKKYSLIVHGALRRGCTAPSK